VDDNRAIFATISVISVSVVALVLGTITYYSKMPWYGSIIFSAIAFPSLPFIIWGDNVTSIIQTILSFFKKKEKE